MASGRKDDATKLIGQKLLQGWTMLQDTCANESCPGVPLMRKPGAKEMVCVNCNTTFVREQDVDKTKHAPTSAAAPVSTPAPAVAPATAAPTAAAPTSTTKPTTAGQGTEETAAVLKAKLQHLTAMLSSAVHPADITAIARAIEAVSQAAASLTLWQ